MVKKRSVSPQGPKEEAAVSGVERLQGQLERWSKH